MSSQWVEKYARVQVSPGICGFTCTVQAHRAEKRAVTVSIEGSACQQVQQLASLLTRLTLNDVFKPFTRNPVFVCAEKAGCHPACPVPTAVIKAAEVALETALPADGFITFQTGNQSSGSHSGGSMS